MSTPIPSKQALRHLASLCYDSRLPVKPTRAFSSCSSRKTSAPATSHRASMKHTSYPIQLHRPFSTTLPAHTQPTPLDPSLPPQPNTSTPYTLFPLTPPLGPPPSGPFTIPLRPLHLEYLRLQASYHPDKTPSGPMHTHALALSATINTSYHTLSDPLLRAQYLLQATYAIDVTSEDNTAHPTDVSTLAEVMDVQETIDEATSAEEVAGLMAANEVRIEETTGRMAEAFERGDGEVAKRSV